MSLGRIVPVVGRSDLTKQGGGASTALDLSAIERQARERREEEIRVELRKNIAVWVEAKGCNCVPSAMKTLGRVEVDGEWHRNSCPKALASSIREGTFG